jgi:hypothetical protein
MAIGGIMYSISQSYLRGIEIQEIANASYCESSSCLWNAVIASAGWIGGGIVALVGIFLALLAVFQKLGKQPQATPKLNPS